jgi:hypothetical protein
MIKIKLYIYIFILFYYCLLFLSTVRFFFSDNSSILNDLPQKYKTKVLDKISTAIPLKITANLVQEQQYWERCCKARWEICDVSQYGRDWKRMYFERNLQLIVEHFVPFVSCFNTGAKLK